MHRQFVCMPMKAFAWQMKTCTHVYVNKRKAFHTRFSQKDFYVNFLVSQTPGMFETGCSTTTHGSLSYLSDCLVLP